MQKKVSNFSIQKLVFLLCTTRVHFQKIPFRTTFTTVRVLHFVCNVTKSIFQMTTHPGRVPWGFTVQNRELKQRRRQRQRKLTSPEHISLSHLCGFAIIRVPKGGSPEPWSPEFSAVEPGALLFYWLEP